jgi:chromate transporter
MIKLFAIFIAFFRVGAFTLGGGYAMFSVLRYELIVKRGWVSEEEFTQELAMASSIPGAMVINFSLFCGSKLRGRPGAFAAFLGTVLPSFLMILIAAAFLFPYFKHHTVAAFLRGAAAVVAGLLAYTALKLCKPMISRVSHAVAALIAAGIALIPDVNPIFALILVSAAVYLLSINRRVKTAVVIDTVNHDIINGVDSVNDNENSINKSNNGINTTDDNINSINNGNN